MKRGHAYGFDENEETQAEAFRFITISAMLLDGLFNQPAVELSHFLDTSLYPVILHYLRPVVEGGNTTVGVMLKRSAWIVATKVVAHPLDLGTRCTLIVDVLVGVTVGEESPWFPTPSQCRDIE